MINKILVVCVGNICRSPIATALLRERVNGLQIVSAGLAAKVGEQVDKFAAQLAEKHGLNVAGHRGQQLEDRMIHEADLVLVMTRGQQSTVQARNPAASGKVLLFGQWLDDAGSEQSAQEIPDPYGKSKEKFEQVHELLTRAADAWASRLQDKR